MRFWSRSVKRPVGRPPLSRDPHPAGILAALHPRRVAAGLLVCGSLVASGCQGDAEGAASADDDSGDAKAPIQLVEVIRPRRGEIRDSISLSGDLQAEYSIDITSRVSAVAAEVPVRPGDAVRKGDLLLKLEDDELQIAARLEEQAYRESQERVRSAEIEHQEAIRDAKAKEIERKRVETELARLEELVETATGALSLEEVETKRFAVEESRLGSETAGLVGQRKAILAKLAEISVQQAKARWDRALLELSRTEVRSPIDGDVAHLEVRPGETVRNDMMVASVVNRDLLHTEVGVPQRRLPSVRVGQEVEIEAESYPGMRFPGRLEAVHPTVDPQEGTVKVRIAVVDPRGLLRPGIYVTTRIVLSIHERALLVPKRARLFDGDEAIVFVIRDGRAVRVPVPVGLQTAAEFEVVEPSDGNGADGVHEARLRDDDLVVIRGQTHLKQGAPVRIKSEEPSPAGVRVEEPESSPESDPPRKS